MSRGGEVWQQATDVQLEQEAENSRLQPQAQSKKETNFLMGHHEVWLRAFKQCHVDWEESCSWNYCSGGSVIDKQFSYDTATTPWSKTLVFQFHVSWLVTFRPLILSD